MPDTLERSHPITRADTVMTRQPKKETHPVRIYKDQADDVAALADLYGKDIAEFLKATLAELIQDRRADLDFIKKRRAESDKAADQPKSDRKKRSG